MDLQTDPTKVRPVGGVMASDTVHNIFRPYLDMLGILGDATWSSMPEVWLPDILHMMSLDTPTYHIQMTSYSSSTLVPCMWNTITLTGDLYSEQLLSLDRDDMPETVLGSLKHNLYQLLTDNFLATDLAGNIPARLGVLWPHLVINVLLPVGQHAKFVAEQDDDQDLAEMLLGQALHQSTQLQGQFHLPDNLLVLRGQHHNVNHLRWLGQKCGGGHQHQLDTDHLHHKQPQTKYHCMPCDHQLDHGMGVLDKPRMHLLLWHPRIHGHQGSPVRQQRRPKMDTHQLAISPVVKITSDIGQEMFSSYLKRSILHKPCPSKRRNQDVHHGPQPHHDLDDQQQVTPVHNMSGYVKQELRDGGLVPSQ